MNKGPLFSTYKQGENRVTSSMLAVFERIDVAAVETLLQVAAEESALELVRFDNQVPGVGSVPDAAISANFRYLFEVKIKRGTVDISQLRAHLNGLDGRSADERLFVLTPDDEEPTQVADIADGRVTWFSFRALSDAIDGLVNDPLVPLADRGSYLLRELQQLFEAEGLLALPEDVVVVAARQAHTFYLRHHAYRCQAGRSFRDGLSYLGFYADKTIRRQVAAILLREDDVVVSEETIGRLSNDPDPLRRRLGEVIRATIDEEPELIGWTGQFFILSGPDDRETLILKGAVEHVGSSAWVQKQRYVTSEALANAQTTADLID